MAERSLAKRLWYGYLHVMCRLLAAGLCQIRCNGRENVPRSGAVLVLSNHQSLFDPVLVGLACDRRLNFLARDTLFRSKLFGWLIRSLDAVPIDREGLGLGGIKETLRRLKRDEMVLIFPEGRRTNDGNLARLKPGFCALARRGNSAVLPIAIDGAFDAWPRWRPLPRRACIHIEFGPAIRPEEFASMTDEALMAEIERRMQACLAAARAGRLRATAIS